MLKMILATIALLLSSTQVHAGEYAYSQYCLREFRNQFKLDEHYPEYALNCSDGLEFRGNIDDPELYSLAGIHYLRGESPTSINWELQPLIKYLFGLLAFHPLFVQYLFALGIGYLLLLFASQVLPHKGGFFLFLPPMLFLLDRLVAEQLTRPYLDLGQTFFITLFLYLLWLYREEKGKIYPPMLVLGLVALSKSFSIGLVLTTVGMLYLMISNKKLLPPYLRTLFLSALVYILGYSAFFFSHPPLDFLTLHLDILRYYKSYVPEYPMGEIFRIIFRGEWRTWWDDKGLIPAPNWSLLWPVSLLASLYTIAKQSSAGRSLILLHLLWIAFYLAFVSLRLVFPRYLLPILPSLYFVLTCQLASYWYHYRNGRQRRVGAKDK